MDYKNIDITDISYLQSNEEKMIAYIYKTDKNLVKYSSELSPIIFKRIQNYDYSIAKILELFREFFLRPERACFEIEQLSVEYVHIITETSYICNYIDSRKSYIEKKIKNLEEFTNIQNIYKNILVIFTEIYNKIIEKHEKIVADVVIVIV
jgi:hypothetical protein